MPVEASDIIVYGSTNMPEGDTSTSGGGINRTIKILSQDMSDIGGADTLDIVSDNAGDTTQEVVITGRDASGIIITDTYSLNGTTPVAGTETFSRILKIVVDGSYTGTLTVSENSGSVELTTLEGTADAPGGTAVLQVKRPFYNAVAEPSTGSAKVFYEKVFIANTNESLALLNAAIELTDDGSGDNVDFDLDATVNGISSVSNRLTEPSDAATLGDPTWNDSLKNVPGGNLGDRTTGTSDRIGVWMRLSLAAGQAPANTSITFSVTGSSI
jgi:hypothetical protein